MATMKMGSDYDQNEEGPPGTDDVKPYTREELEALLAFVPGRDKTLSVAPDWNRLLATAREDRERLDEIVALIADESYSWQAVQHKVLGIMNTRSGRGASSEEKA